MSGRHLIKRGNKANLTYNLAQGEPCFTLDSKELFIGGVGGNVLVGGEFSQNTLDLGYLKIPSGLILQWGFITASANLVATPLTFPIAFPNACLSISCIAGAPDQATCSVFSITSTGCQIYLNSGGPKVVRWMAIGK